MGGDSICLLLCGCFCFVVVVVVVVVAVVICEILHSAATTPLAWPGSVRVDAL